MRAAIANAASVMMLMSTAEAWTAQSFRSTPSKYQHLRSRHLILQELSLDDEGEDAAVDLVEDSSGRILPCFLAASIEYEGQNFAALYPVNAPVTFARKKGDALVQIDSDHETPELLKTAAKACTAQGVELHETPVVYTASGPGLDEIDEDETLEFFTDDVDDESEEALIVAEMSVEGKALCVVQTLDPLYVVGKEVGPKEYTVPSDPEIDAVSDIIEELLIEFEAGMEEAMLQDDDGFDV